MRTHYCIKHRCHLGCEKLFCCCFFTRSPRTHAKNFCSHTGPFRVMNSPGFSAKNIARQTSPITLNFHYHSGKCQWLGKCDDDDDDSRGGDEDDDEKRRTHYAFENLCESFNCSFYSVLGLSFWLL